MTNKVLVVGGAGYIGSVLVRKLIDLGYSVSVLDTMWFGSHGIEGLDEVELFVGDMRNPPGKCFDGVDVVVNLGGMSNDPTSEYNPEKTYEINTKGALELAEHAIKNGVYRYIFASTCSIYSSDLNTGYLEKEFTELDKCSPKYTYSKSKFDAENLLLNFSSSHPLFKPTILRKGTAFGYSPRMRFDLVVNSMYRSIIETGKIEVHHGGKMWRPLVSVDTICEIYAKIIGLHPSRVNKEVINVSSGNIKVLELAKMIKEISSKVLGIIPELKVISGNVGNTRSYKVDAQLLKRKYSIDVPTLEYSIYSEFMKMSNHTYNFNDSGYYNIEIMDDINGL